MAETLELIARAKAGESGCMEDLLQIHSPALLGRIRLMLGEGARRAAESGDFLHDVFAKILRDFHRFEPRDRRSFLRWATQIARNSIRHTVRARHERAVERFAVTTVSTLVDDAPTPQAALDKQLRIEEVIETLEELDEDRRRVLELRHFEDLSFAEIGERLGRSANAAEVLHRRAVTSLGRLVRQRRHS